MAQRRQLLAAHRLGPGRQRDVPGRGQLDERHVLVPAPAGATGVSAGFYVDSTSVIQRAATATRSTTRAWSTRRGPLTRSSVSSAGAGSGTRDEQPGRHRLRRRRAPATSRRHERDADGRRLRRARAFAGWSGACAAPGTCTVTMSQARSVTATFTSTPVLTPDNRQGGHGHRVGQRSPAGINCGATCAATSPTARSSR